MAFDIHFQVAAPEVIDETQRYFSFGQKRPVGVRGLQKLLNLFVKHLFTPVGSNPLDREEGTSLPRLLGSNIDPDDAEDVLELAVDRTVAAIQAAQRGQEIPAEERLASASVTGFLAVPSSPGFSAQIFLRSVAGKDLVFDLPTLSVRQ